MAITKIPGRENDLKEGAEQLAKLNNEIRIRSLIIFNFPFIAIDFKCRIRPMQPTIKCVPLYLYKEAKGGNKFNETPKRQVQSA
jgi:hypothetical protein